MCRPRRIDFQNGPDGILLSHFTEDFLRILRDLGAESVLEAAWQRQDDDPFPKRRCHEQAERGGRGL